MASDAVAKASSSSLLAWALFFARWTTYFSISVTTILIGALYTYQNSLIYPSAFPEGSRSKVPRPNEFGMSDFQDLVLKAADGVNLSCYFIKKSPIAKVTLIYYHANAGNMGHRLPIAKFLMDKLGCNILMLSYRGYGYFPMLT
jgi:hypothetical protein